MSHPIKGPTGVMYGSGKPVTFSDVVDLIDANA